MSVRRHWTADEARIKKSRNTIKEVKNQRVSCLFNTFIMVTLIALFSTLAATLSLSSAAPSKRQTPDTCSSFANAALAVRPKGTNDSPTWVGVVQGVTHAGIDGQPASILVTKDDNGE